MNNQHLVSATLQYLIAKAMSGQTSNYDELARHIGTPDSGNALGGVLGPILGDALKWCRNHGLLHLTSLVVIKHGTSQGIPGVGFWELLGLGEMTIAEKRSWIKHYHREVFNYWSVGGFVNVPKFWNGADINESELNLDDGNIHQLNTMADIARLEHLNNLVSMLKVKFKEIVELVNKRGSTSGHIQSGFVDRAHRVPQSELMNTTATYYVNVFINWDTSEGMGTPYMTLSFNSPLTGLMVAFKHIPFFEEPQVVVELQRAYITPATNGCYVEAANELLAELHKPTPGDHRV